jgi:hypothetical protein
MNRANIKQQKNKRVTQVKHRKLEPSRQLPHRITRKRTRRGSASCMSINTMSGSARASAVDSNHAIASSIVLQQCSSTRNNAIIAASNEGDYQ